MSSQNGLDAEIAELIVSSLSLESVLPANIDPTVALFGEGLGLDSIDALEIAMIIEKKYGVKLRSDNPNISNIFTSLRSLSEYVGEHRVR
mgnify:CR=1 FL=1